MFWLRPVQTLLKCSTVTDSAVKQMTRLSTRLVQTLLKCSTVTDTQITVEQRVSFKLVEV